LTWIDSYDRDVALLHEFGSRLFGDFSVLSVFHKVTQSASPIANPHTPVTASPAC